MFQIRHSGETRLKNRYFDTTVFDMGMSNLNLTLTTHLMHNKRELSTQATNADINCAISACICVKLFYTMDKYQHQS